MLQAYSQFNGSEKWEMKNWEMEKFLLQHYTYSICYVLDVRLMWIKHNSLEQRICC